MTFDKPVIGRKFDILNAQQAASSKLLNFGTERGNMLWNYLAHGL